jgi:glucose/arabinose dehydrogenase
MILFAPDGMLLIGMGDGGSGGDPQGHGQNRATLLGDLLRLDVSTLPYSIPPDNPYAGQTGIRAEIWAYGLRNPWRFSVDHSAGLIYIADVGQNRLEEVNVAPVTTAGINYGWNITEGGDCYNNPFCNKSGVTQPVLDYGRDDGCTVIGGYVYRGSAMPEVAGHYFYSDYCEGWLRSFRYQDGAAAERREWDVGNVGTILSFGEDAAGELYVLTQNSLYQIVKRA